MLGYSGPFRSGSANEQEIFVDCSFRRVGEREREKSKEIYVRRRGRRGVLVESSLIFVEERGEADEERVRTTQFFVLKALEDEERERARTTTTTRTKRARRARIVGRRHGATSENINSENEFFARTE